ncbi:MAG: hypothetical protein AAF607_11905 [Pseudomonadota bacterium]
MPAALPVPPFRQRSFSSRFWSAFDHLHLKRVYRLRYNVHNEGRLSGRANGIGDPDTMHRSFFFAASTALLTVTLSHSATAADTSKCGDAPALPAMFDTNTAQIADIKRVKNEYQTYQDSTTVYLKCLDELSKSDEIQGMKKKKRKAAERYIAVMKQKTIVAEQDFANAFNANFTRWKENRMAAK